MEVARRYRHCFDLKYGCNPHQVEAAILSTEKSSLPFNVVNGNPGYINLLDALNAWQLVRELDEALEMPAAASFKHVSPAGAAVGIPLNPTLDEVYDSSRISKSSLTNAYIRARGADPLCSFGDFIALSREVDPQTAEMIRNQVSDGIIAPAYSREAIQILKKKKHGSFIILRADPDFKTEDTEYREIFGVVFRQKRGLGILNERSLLGQLVTRSVDLPKNARRDLVLASIAIRYTQSNSVGYALDGQMIGIGAGQQSRVDCTKLAGRKAEIWHLRSHPRVLSLPFREKTSSVERNNARIAFIDGDMTQPERRKWLKLFNDDPGQLSEDEKEIWIKGMDGVSISSDAFFPFRDNLDQAYRRGVKYVVQPGGSVRDDELIEAADEYEMVMAFSGIRLFHH